MSVYYLTIFAVFFFAFFANVGETAVNKNIIVKNSRSSKAWLFCAATVLIFVAGFRYYVGTDYGGYYKIFKDSSWGKFQENIKNLNEPGFPFLAEVVKWFTDDGAAFIFVTAAFTIGAVLYITYKDTDAYLFVSLLFIFVGIWHGSFNGVRQYFAAAVICLGYKNILDKRFWKYLLYVFIAFLFHSSAIIAILFYFILRNKVSVKNVLIFIIGSIILLYNYDFIFSFVGNLKNETIDASNSYMSNQVNILRVLANVSPAVFCLFIYSKEEKNAEQTFYFNILILYALLSVIGMNSPYLSRVSIYLGVFLPLAMGKLIVFKDKKTEFIVKLVIISLFFVFWLYEVSHSADLRNFQWVWER